MLSPQETDPREGAWGQLGPGEGEAEGLKSGVEEDGGGPGLGGGGWSLPGQGG